MGDTTKVIGQQEVGRCPGWRDGAADLPGTSAASELGPGEALGLARAAASGRGPARHQHRRGPLGSPRAREEAAAPAPLPASGRCPADHGAAQTMALAYPGGLVTQVLFEGVPRFGL